jgi:hypothetical protein
MLTLLSFPVATSWNGWGDATGTVSLHSWNDQAEDDEGDPPLGTNYNARLEVKEAYNKQMKIVRESGGALQSRVVRPARFGAGDRLAGW